MRRDNNFNLIRFVAAAAVAFSHSFPLTGNDASEPLKAFTKLTLGTVAVDIFFVTSGFLVTASALSRPRVLEFLWARSLRIFPALIVAVMFCTWVIGPLFTAETMHDYFAAKQTLQYLWGNASLLSIEYDLPGVFTGNAYPEAVNGSLWTLPWEVKMYMLLATIVMLAGKHARSIILWLATIGAALTLAHYFFNLLESKRLIIAAPFLACFFGGASLYLWKDDIEFKPTTVLACAAVVGALLLLSPRLFFYPALLILLPYITIGSAFFPSGALLKFNKLGDYSYGVYVYAFPVQQCVAATFTAVTPMQMFALTLPITLVLAFLSWHLVEKRCLEFKTKAIEAPIDLSAAELSSVVDLKT